MELKSCRAQSHASASVHTLAAAFQDHLEEGYSIREQADYLKCPYCILIEGLQGYKGHLNSSVS